MNKKQQLEGWLFISPWVIGFVLFSAGPILASLGLSFTDWDALSRPHWVGGGNYARMLQDPLVSKSLANTFWYALASVPLGMIVSLGLAVLLNQKLRGMAFFRTLFYFPSITAGIATYLLWAWLLNPSAGPVNAVLKPLTTALGIKPPGWLTDVHWALPAMVLMSLWTAGGGMVIYLAGLQGIPQHLYQAAELDGASGWQKFLNVTLPLLSPTIFFHLVMSTIGSFQVYTAALVMTNGGPSNATMFYGLYLFKNAFEYFRLGYASALAWLLFLVILGLTAIQFKAAPRWVHY